MRDILGEKLFVGDIVVMHTSGYVGISIARIEKFCKIKVSVKSLKSNGGWTVSVANAEKLLKIGRSIDGKSYCSLDLNRNIELNKI